MGGGFVLLAVVLLLCLPYCQSQEGVTSQLARVRQTFRFTYQKLHNVSCPDLTAYTQLLQPALRQSEQQLPNTCAVEKQDKQITGQLSVINITQNIHQVLVNITLTYDERVSEHGQGICGQLVIVNFKGNDLKLTAPFRNTTFSPGNGCPSIVTNKGANLVQTEFFCTTGIKATDNSTSPERVVCVNCEACQQESHEDQANQTVCKICPLSLNNTIPYANATTIDPSDYENDRLEGSTSSQESESSDVSLVAVAVVGWALAAVLLITTVALIILLPKQRRKS